MCLAVFALKRVLLFLVFRMVVGGLADIGAMRLDMSAEKGQLMSPNNSQIEQQI
jgi:hypothetical protein